MSDPLLLWWPVCLGIPQYESLSHLFISDTLCLKHHSSPIPTGTMEYFYTNPVNSLRCPVVLWLWVMSPYSLLTRTRVLLVLINKSSGIGFLISSLPLNVNLVNFGRTKVVYSSVVYHNSDLKSGTQYRRTSFVVDLRIYCDWFSLFSLTVS